jgi:uncharacterized protein YjeT (DUF2065 family)
MSTLAALTLGLGAVLLPIHSMLIMKPALTRKGFNQFPRCRWCGWLLAIVAIVWAAWLLNSLPLGRFESLKQWLIPVTVVFTGLVFFAMDDLLAPRALGALLLLYPAPLLHTARLHPSKLSVIMSIIAYVLIIKGMALMLSPYLFRQNIERFLKADHVCRLAGIVGIVFDGCLILLALLAY